MDTIRLAIKDMSTVDIVMMAQMMKASEDPSDVQFRKELLMELKIRQQEQK